MIRRAIVLFLTFIVLLPTYADEGMWVLPFIQELNMGKMEELGCELSMDDIYRPGGKSLKDVIGSLDYGSCTAGIISEEGLILTNHHCGEDEIQSHSTPEHDYLSDGFWAMSKEEELPNPGKTISFIIRMEEVTERVTSLVHHEMTTQEREAEIEEISELITEEATEETHYEAVVLPFYEGLRYFLVVMETFRDVRLVGAPPESIGSFGGSKDNWEWPRHNADFSLMRIYTAPDGTPADYSPENIPYQTENHLPVSLEGYNENDFTMVLGFPGTTSRNLTSARVNELAEIENTNRIRIRKVALDIIEEDMLADDKVRIQYTAKHSRLSNYYKYSIGQNRSISLLGVTERRKALEDEFMDWVEMDSSRQEKYSGSIQKMVDVIEERKEMENALSYLEETFLLHDAVEIFGFAASALPLYFNELGYGSGEESREDLIMELDNESKGFFRDFNPSTDKKIANKLINQYAYRVEPIYFPGFFSTLRKKFHNDIEKYLSHLYKKSVFADQTKFNKFIQDSKHKKLLKDPAFLGAFSLYNTYYQILMEYEDLEAEYAASSMNYLEGLMEMFPDSNFYPDANSTLRMTYGTISGYHARDAVDYNYFTTLKGVIEKEDPWDRDFYLPEGLKELFRKKQYYPYSKDSVMNVCFLTNLDTSGGNSGSPVLNRRGEVIGLNFDGTWESMSGDIIYEPEFQRSICVDIRYILFIIDKFAEAEHLVKEMNIYD